MGDYGPNVQLPKAEVLDSTPARPTDSSEINVLITGFGPFKTNLVNASWLIASSLPSSFTFPEKPTMTEGVTHEPRRISLHVHPAPIPVAYSSVRTMMPEILEDYAKEHDGRRPDLIIHMGIASTRRHYSVETQAHRGSYHLSDVKGRSGYEDGEKIWKELDLPAVLEPGLASETTGEENAKPTDTTTPRVHPHPPDSSFLSAWKSFCPPDTDIRLSTDAGRYLCEFIFYTSMAIALREQKDRNVVFFHVPALCEDEDIALGREIAMGLIKTLVTRWIDENGSGAAMNA